MEAIFLNSIFKMTRLIDAFSSFIWNDMYIGCGNFELRYPMDSDSLNDISLGQYVSTKESDRYMIVEKMEIKTSVEDGNTVTISGRSLESLLDRRIVIERTVLYGNLQDAIYRLVSLNALNPANPRRILSPLRFTWSYDPLVTDLDIEFTVEAGSNLYDVVYDICTAYHVGFRILPGDDGLMYFGLYSGANRSYSQDTNPWVVFSPKFENIQETDMIVDTTNLRNVAYSETTYTERIEQEDGSYLEEEKTIRVEIDDGYSDLERREMFDNSYQIPEQISRDDFGQPEDRVDKRRYGTDVFNEEAYQRWRAADEQYRIYGCYHDSNTGEMVYQQPTQADFNVWEFVLDQEDAYNAAVEQANHQIQIEYEAAIANAANTAESLLRADTEISLAEYAKIMDFDGQVAPDFQYLVNKDYFLGDVVQIVNEYGMEAVTRVVGILYSEEESTGYVMSPQFASDDKEAVSI